MESVATCVSVPEQKTGRVTGKHSYDDRVFTGAGSTEGETYGDIGGNDPSARRDSTHKDSYRRRIPTKAGSAGGRTGRNHAPTKRIPTNT